MSIIYMRGLYFGGKTGSFEKVIFYTGNICGFPNASSIVIGTA